VNDLLQGWIFILLCEVGLASGSRDGWSDWLVLNLALREGTAGVALSGIILKQLWPKDADQLSLPGKQRRTEYPTELEEQRRWKCCGDLIQSLR